MSKYKILVVISALFILSACTLPITPTYTPPQTDIVPTVNVAQTLDAVRTEAILTEAARLPTATLIPPTHTSAPSFTPLPSETGMPRPTFTLTHTATPTWTPTFTATATFTPTFTSTATPTRTFTNTVATGPTPRLIIAGVERNKAVTVRTDNFPAGQIFTIRMGPFKTFSRDNMVTGTIHSGNGGSFLVTVNIPPAYYNEDRITIRMDSYQGYYAFNVFTNTTSGTIVYTATPIPPTVCEVSASPKQYTVFAPNAEFDAVWTVKNTSNTTWDKSSVDYKYVSGTEMQKYNKYYDMTATVDPGETTEIIVDMIAPSQKGTYSTNWAIVLGDRVLCNMPITIVVR